MTSRRRRRNMSPALQKHIEDKAASGYSATDIYRELEKNGPHDLPTLRTVQNVVKDQELRDKTGPWSVADKGQDGTFLSTPEDARIILDVLADVILTLGRKRGFTKAEAAWVLRISKLAPPGLPHMDVWVWARAYMAAESKGESTEALDTYFAFKPWRSKNRFGNYKYALERGWIKEDPDGTWRFSQMNADLASYPEQPSSEVDEDPLLLRFRFESLDRAGSRAVGEIQKRHRIREQNPELDKKIDKAWNDACQRKQQILKEWKERGKTKLTDEDIKAAMEELGPKWDEYRRLVDSFEEAK